MMKFIIKWDAGYGTNYDVIDAVSLEDAQRVAYEQWKEEVESNADYDAMEWTQELEEELI